MKKTKQLTELVFILDRSGSMQDLEKDTIGGFNSMIKKQKDSKVNALVTTVLFDDESVVLHDRVKIDEVPEMTNKEYYARGMTALLDAVGSTIKHIETIQKYARKEDKPAKTLFMITTDGYENSSRTYTFKKVKQLIEKQKEKNGWEFVFIGSNMDAIESASKIGISRDYAATSMGDEKGTEVLYKTVGDVCCCCCLEAEPLKPNWKEKIEKDDLQRKKTK